jgi:hypothetical protein
VTPASESQKRPHQRPVRPNTNGQPPTRHVNENHEPANTPLYRRQPPDSRLQHRALLWVGLTLIAGSASVCVVAIAVGSVPTALITAILILAAALTCIVRYLFPRSSRRSD